MAGVAQLASTALAVLLAVSAAQGAKIGREEDITGSTGTALPKLLTEQVKSNPVYITCCYLRDILYSSPLDSVGAAEYLGTFKA